MKQSHKVRIGKLSEFRPQVVNANKHSERGLRMLDDAMSEDGYVAPATATADKEVIDGSARLERAFDKFDDEAIILEHDGTRPIITVRTDIPNANTKEAKRIAVRANAVAAADLEWDASILAQLKDEGVELSGMFTEKELAALLPQGESKDAEPQIDKAGELQKQWGTESGQLWLVWDKQGGAKDTTFATCELAWCSESQPARVLTHVWDGFRRDSEKGEDRFHANQKPVAVIQWALSWLKGSLVADFYAGVGAGMVACENLNRTCYAMDSDPAYCAVILERMTTAFPSIKIEREAISRAA